jgi:hypothetical protein
VTENVVLRTFPRAFEGAMRKRFSLAEDNLV